jgi:hypothetical protein
MNHMRSFSRRTSCLVLVTALLCATFGTDTAIAQPPRSPFRKEAVPPALTVNPQGVPPTVPSPRVPYSDVPPALSVNPSGGGAPQSNYSAVPLPAVSAPSYSAIPPSMNGNLSYAINSICMTPAGNCAAYQAQGTQCQCSDGFRLYVGIAQ